MLFFFVLQCFNKQSQLLIIHNQYSITVHIMICIYSEMSKGEIWQESLEVGRACGRNGGGMSNANGLRE